MKSGFCTCAIAFQTQSTARYSGTYRRFGTSCRSHVQRLCSSRLDFECTVLLPPGVNPVAVNKYIISYHLSYHLSYIYHITSYHIVSYIISYIVSYHIISYHISYRIIYHIISYHISYISYHIKILPCTYDP